MHSLDDDRQASGEINFPMEPEFVPLAKSGFASKSPDVVICIYPLTKLNRRRWYETVFDKANRDEARAIRIAARRNDLALPTWMKEIQSDATSRQR